MRSVAHTSADNKVNGLKEVTLALRLNALIGMSAV